PLSRPTIGIAFPSTRRAALMEGSSMLDHQRLGQQVERGAGEGEKPCAPPHQRMRSLFSANRSGGPRTALGRPADGCGSGSPQPPSPLHCICGRSPTAPDFVEVVPKPSDGRSPIAPTLCYVYFLPVPRPH